MFCLLRRIVFFVVVAGMGATSCNGGTSVGLPCDMGVDGGTASVIVIREPALECAGRVCLAFGSKSARCSAPCNTAEDCSDESAGAMPCHSGFVCGVASDVGPYSCRKLCICRDDTPFGWSETPAACR